jgi:hypothetical protein
MGRSAERPKTLQHLRQVPRLHEVHGDKCIMRVKADRSISAGSEKERDILSCQMHVRWVKLVPYRLADCSFCKPRQEDLNMRDDKSLA